MKIYILCFTLLMYSCGPSSEELGDLWFKYSAGKLKKELGRILTQKNDNGEEKYEYAPMYEWGEYMGNTRAEAAIYYYSNGSGQATMWHPYTGSVSESGSWKIQWAPATDASPYDSDIIFTIRGSGKFSHHIGSDNKLWTPIEEFCKAHLTEEDANRFMAYGDSLRAAFMKEKNCQIGEDGKFK